MSSNNSTAEHLTGRVKWFNNKSGYGFITVTDGVRSGFDVFVHHSAVNVENQYKYLVQGEYVEFNLIKTDSGAHEWQASNVSGIKGGKLMCETRNELKAARTEYKNVQHKDAPKETRVPRQTSTNKAQPVKTNPDKKWSVVARDNRKSKGVSNKK